MQPLTSYEDITPLSYVLMRQSRLPSNTNPKIFAIHSHGCCRSSSQEIETPVRVITTADLGQSHRHMFLDDSQQFNPPLLLNFFERINRQPRKDIPAIQTVLGEMCDASIIQCSPHVHEVGSNIEDISLFCSGSAAAEAIFEIDTMTGIKRDVSMQFGMHTVKDDDRASKKNEKMETRFVSGPSEQLRRELRKEKARLEQKKLGCTPPQVDELNYEIANYNAAVYATIQHLSASSRLAHNETNGEVLLSKLLQDGVTSRVINPATDIVVVFACKHIRTESDSGPSGSSAGAGARAGGTKKRYSRTKRLRRKRKQQKSKYRKNKNKN